MRLVVTMTVGADQDGQLLVDWLVYHLVDETRSGILRALKAGRVAVDRRPVSDPNTPLKVGAQVGFQEAGDDPDSASPWTRARAGHLVRAPSGEER